MEQTNRAHWMFVSIWSSMYSICEWGNVGKRDVDQCVEADSDAREGVRRGCTCSLWFGRKKTIHHLAVASICKLLENLHFIQLLLAALVLMKVTAVELMRWIILEWEQKGSWEEQQTGRWRGGGGWMCGFDSNSRRTAGAASTLQGL